VACRMEKTANCLNEGIFRLKRKGPEPDDAVLRNSALGR